MLVINPATEEVIADLTEDVPAALNQQLKHLKEGQSTWSGKSLAERIAVMKRYNTLLSENIEHLAAVLTSEVGKPLQQSRNEINGAKARIQWMTDHADKYLSDEIMTESKGLIEKISYEPLGIVCNISAWNYPYLVGTNVFVPGLMAGNSVMYKPSEYASLTGLEIGKLLHRAGVPENVFQVAIGGKTVGEALLTMDFDGYFFTGSYRTGQHIFQKVSARMIPCQCEMGGKDPLYVADDVVEVKSVAAATADGAFYNNGQSCCAVERIYVHEKVYDEYVSEFVKEVKSYKMGLPTDDGIYVGPLTRREQLDIVQAQVDQAAREGATVLLGGRRAAGKGYYFEPTVLTEVTHDMQVMREESFGPVIGIMKVKDDREAIQLMADTEYGLTASVYSSDQQRAESILKKINAGTGYWNCCDRVSAAVPWSGRKHSGFGSTLSHQGLRAFTKTKSWHLKV